MRVMNSRYRFHGQAGFTAIEVSAVATIIAILALVLIPIMRGRVEQAKVVAAQEDLFSLEKAELLAFADTGHYFRLQDLTRPQADLDILNDPANIGTAAFDNELLKVPQAYWNQEASPTERVTIAKMWKGKQIAIQNSMTMEEIDLLYPTGGGGLQIVSRQGNPGGPILILDQIDEEDWAATAGGLTRAIYPIDPWGTPYLFLGSGRTSAPAGRIGLAPNLTAETNFTMAVVYSLGPDGRPGNNSGANHLHFYRETWSVGALGTDDLVREF